MPAARRLWFLLVAGGVLCALAGFGVGRAQAGVQYDEVGCLSAPGTISCELPDDWTVAVPRDVTWTDASGGLHQDGRPRCLPPTGRGLEGPVGLSWVPVEVDGLRWRQVVSVRCLG